jgi:hypothetical protein
MIARQIFKRREQSVGSSHEINVMSTKPMDDSELKELFKERGEWIKGGKSSDKLDLTGYHQELSVLTHISYIRKDLTAGGMLISKQIEYSAPSVNNLHSSYSNINSYNL